MMSLAQRFCSCHCCKRKKNIKKLRSKSVKGRRISLKSSEEKNGIALVGNLSQQSLRNLGIARRLDPSAKDTAPGAATKQPKNSAVSPRENVSLLDLFDSDSSGDDEIEADFRKLQQEKFDH